MKQLFILCLVCMACNCGLAEEFKYKGLNLRELNGYFILESIDTFYYQSNKIKTCVIPDFIKYKNRKLPIKVVKYIPSCEMIEKIIIPTSVETIAPHALGCNKARKIIVKSNIETINEYTFSGCHNLKTIELPKTVKSIERSAFSGCRSLEKIKLKSGIEQIKEHAFLDCKNLHKFFIPKGIDSFDMLALWGCDKIESLYFSETVKSVYVIPLKSLKHIKVNTKNKHLKSIKGVLFSSDGEKLILYPMGLEKKSYRVDDSVRVIGESAFSHANKLETVILPSKLELIEDYAFEHCSNLCRLEFPSHDFQIKESSFYLCNKSLLYGMPQIDRKSGWKK